MGHKITALQAQQRNQDRVNVFLDGVYAFSLDNMTAARLRPGQVLTDLEITQLQETGAVAKAYEQAVRFLGTRPRSIEEVRRKLVENDYSSLIIETVLTRLESQGFVNDVEFARYWVRNRGEFNPRGPSALRAELRAKGVANEIIDEALGDLDTTDSALEAARQKARSLRGLDQRTFRQKLGSYLVRRGFDYDTARAATDALLEELDKDDTTEE